MHIKEQWFSNIKDVFRDCRRAGPHPEAIAFSIIAGVIQLGLCIVDDGCRYFLCRRKTRDDFGSNGGDGARDGSVGS